MATFQIPSISTNQDYISVFGEKSFDKELRGGMLLTDRIDAQNFRIRESEPGYETDWHMAGDPTLIVVQAGTLRIELRNGSFRDFNAGEMFIAKDNLPGDVTFDNQKHGHRALVIGDKNLRAVHIKLGSPWSD